MIQKRIKTIIKQIRQDAKEYLNSRDGFTGEAAEELPLVKICQKLRQNTVYRGRKREVKAVGKGIVTTLQQTCEQLKSELKRLELETIGVQS